MKEEDYQAKQEGIVRSFLKDRRRLGAEASLVCGAAYMINEGLKALNKIPSGPLTRPLCQVGVSLSEEALEHVDERLQRLKERSTEAKAAIYYLQDRTTTRRDNLPNFVLRLHIVNRCANLILMSKLIRMFTMSLYSKNF